MVELGEIEHYDALLVYDSSDRAKAEEIVQQVSTQRHTNGRRMTVCLLERNSDAATLQDIVGKCTLSLFLFSPNYCAKPDTPLDLCQMTLLTRACCDTQYRNTCIPVHTEGFRTPTKSYKVPFGFARIVSLYLEDERWIEKLVKVFRQRFLRQQRTQ